MRQEQLIHSMGANTAMGWQGHRFQALPEIMLFNGQVKLKSTASGPHRGSEDECQEERGRKEVSRGHSSTLLVRTRVRSTLQRKLELETILLQTAHQEVTRCVMWLSARPCSLQQQHPLHSQETESKCLPPSEWIKKRRYVFTTECYAAVKMK